MFELLFFISAGLLIVMTTLVIVGLYEHGATVTRAKDLATLARETAAQTRVALADARDTNREALAVLHINAMHDQGGEPNAVHRISKRDQHN